MVSEHRWLLGTMLEKDRQVPQLPSGRHAAIDPAKLFKLFRDAQEGRFVHRLMAITDMEQLRRFVEVVELLPTDGANAITLNDASIPLPGAFRESPTGVTLEKLGELPWSGPDIEALRLFLTESRAVDLLGNLLKETHRLQNVLGNSGSFAARLQVMWWQAGVHPAQEEKWEDGDSFEWDDYDLFVALTLLVYGLDELSGDLESDALNAIELTRATLKQIVDFMPRYQEALSTLDGYGVRETACCMRDSSLLDDLPKDMRQHGHIHLIESATALCSTIDGVGLRRIDRVAAMIASLAFISSEDA